LSSDGTVLGTYSIVNSNGDILVYDSTSTIVMNIKFTGITVSGEIYLDSLGNVDSGYVIYGGEEYDFGNISYYDPEEMLGQGVSVIYYLTNASGTITDTIMADVPPAPIPGEGIMSWVYEGFLCPTEPEVEYIEQSPFVTYTYDARGKVTKEEYKNGTETVYTYYSSGLPHTIVNKKGNTTLSSYSYTYYPDGNIASVTEIGKVTYYSYDGYGRLTEERTVANNSEKIVSYTYDNSGNRTSKTENGVLTSYTYDNNNRITTELTGTVLTYYSYDNNGNLLSILVGGNYTGKYTYDLFNREKSFTPNFIGYTYYTYRADGLRHSIGSATHCWDGTNIVCDIDGTDYNYFYGT
jgi:YD repeat-containing protein